MIMWDLLNNPAVIGALGMLGGSALALVGKRRETVASIQEVWTKSTATLIEQYTKALDEARAETSSLRHDIADLRAEVAAQTDEIADLNSHIDVLTDSLAKHGITPPARRRRQIDREAI